MSPEKKLREHISELEEELIQLKERFVADQNPFFGRLGLSPQLAVVLWALYQKEMLSNDQLDIITVKYGKGERSDETDHVKLRVKVVLWKLRVKLAVYGIEFQTIWGIGYRMNADSKYKLKQMIRYLGEETLIKHLGKEQ